MLRSVRDIEEGTGPQDARGDVMVAAPRGQLRRGVVAIGSLIALSLLVYALPALLGHPVVPGDDLTQNLPLRVLVARELASGHLPVFDPYIWSGAPLLAGWNAGAAYPLTWLFAVVPAGFAWATTLVVTAVSASVGCYAFLRTSGLGVLASWIGGLTFAFGGAMTAQVPHVGFVAGMSWVPLGLIAVVKLTEPARMRRRLVWTGVLAVAVGLIVLSGEPRAVSDAFVVLVVFALWRVAHDARRASGLARLRGATLLAGGGVLGVALGAVQLVPGLAAIGASQRAVATLTLFSAGSLPTRWLTLLGVPDLLGGSGALGQPHFFGTYNLTEVSCYVGILPLAAAGALFASRRSHPGGWMVWEVVGALGAVLALGGHTPLAHLLVHIPLFGGQRLPSRAILVTDLALAVLLAYWVDRVVGSRAGAAGSVGGGRVDGRTAPASGLGGVHGKALELLLASVGPLCVACIAALALVLGPPFFTWVGALPWAAAQVGGLGPWLVVSLVLSGVALALVWGGRHLGAQALGTCITAFVVADLIFFSVAAVVAVDRQEVGPPASGQPAATLSGAAVAGIRPIAALGIRGRFAVYDPGLFNEPALDALGVPDMNVLARTFSIQGYSSLANDAYARATGSHGVSGTGQDVFSPVAARNGVLDSLDTKDVFTLPRYLVVPQAPGAAALAPSSSAPAAASGGTSAQGPGDRAEPPGAPARWPFGRPFDVASATIVVSRKAARIGLVTVHGAIRWAQTVTTGSHGALRAVWSPPSLAMGLVALGVGQGTTRAGPPSIVTAGGAAFRLDGVLQSALVQPHWKEVANDGPFSVFENTRAQPPLTLRTLSGAAEPDRGAAATLRQASGPFLDPAAASVTSRHGAEVVRAVAAIPGWGATWTPAGGRPEALKVRRSGAVQIVSVPAGSGVLRWHYRAPGLLAGLVVSGAALAALCGVFLVAARTRSRARGAPSSSGVGPTGVSRAAGGFRRRPGGRVLRRGEAPVTPRRRIGVRARRSEPRRPSTPRRAPGARAREGGG